jgi:RNA polymerase sigma-70 factor (ECF subfamily)
LQRKKFSVNRLECHKGPYLKLLQQNPNPFIELNYAIALYYSGKKEDAFTILKMLQQNSFLQSILFAECNLGKMYLLEKDYTNAKEYLLTALKQTNMEAEKNFIRKLLEKAANKE